MLGTNGSAQAAWPANKIALIKEVRDQAGCSLQDAKAAVEESSGNLEGAVLIARRKMAQAADAKQAPPANLTQLIAEVIARTGCSSVVALTALDRAHYQLRTAVSLARLNQFASQPTISVFGRMGGRCPVCDVRGELANVVVTMPGNIGIHGAACWECVRRLHDNIDLLAAFAMVPVG